MALDFSVSAGGATSIFSISPLVLDPDLTVRDLIVSLNGTLVTNWTKTGTSEVTFTAPLPNGSLIFQRVTPAVRKYLYVSGTFMDAGNVNTELDELVRDNAERADQSYLSRKTARSQVGKFVQIGTDGKETLTTITGTGVSLTNPGPIGTVTPDAGKFTTLEATGTTTLNAGVTFAGTTVQKDATLETLGGINPYNKLNTNYLENGDYQLSNRFLSDATAATGKANPANNTYYLDRVVNLQAGTAATWTVSKQPFTLGQTAVPGNPQFFGQWAVTTAAGTSMSRARRIEGTARLSGKTMTYAFWARVTAGTATLSSNTRQYFGSGGSPSADVTTDTSFTAALTTTWTKFTKTYTFGSVSGKTLGTAGDDFTEIRLQFPLTNGVTYQFADEVLVEGSTAPNYYPRQAKQQVEWECFRYFRPFYWSWAGYLSAGGSNRLAHPLTPTMRTTPTRRLTAGDNTDINIGTNLNTGTNVPALGGAFLGGNTAIAIDVAAGGTGNAYVFDYILGADAEMY